MSEILIKRKMVNLKPETYDRLLGVGSMKESFDEVINRLIDVYEKRE